MTNKRLTTPEKFWERVDRSDPLRCWIWTGRRQPNGYGLIGFHAREWVAHRLAYALTFPEWDGKKLVLHRCDNPPCVNPAHLFLGTQADNVADMWAKGRAHDFRGEGGGNVKLTAEQIIAIRTEPLLQRQIAVKYGIERSVVSRIRARKSWQSVP